MYLDYILFAVGGSLLLAALILLIALLRSKHRSRDYRRILSEETERIDVVSTLRQTHSLATASLLRTAGAEETEVLTDPGPQAPAAEETELLSPGELLSGPAPLPAAGVGADLDLSPLEGKYTLLQEIHGGGMSRIFLARHQKLGSQWIVKFVDGRHAELANEADVLKQLNHISLPPIIDIFQSRQGTFLVERYIEGFTLDEVLKSGQELREGQISDWGLQLAHVLRYLHSLDTPIIHCDLKPSNIMVTHDDRLVLIDFGISKRQGSGSGPAGITYRYAAPEQFRGAAVRPDVIADRFGALPPDHQGWPIDVRTDLYSTGVILYELIMGRTPSGGVTDDLRPRVTPKLADVVCRCLQIQPDKRFQSADQLIHALDAVKGQRVTIARKLVLRRIAAVCCGAFLAGGLVTSASGAYVYQMENLSVVSMDPGQAVISAQQSVQILLQKALPGKAPVTLEPQQVRWSYSEDNIARMDGNRLVGLNPGETTLCGQYHNHEITLHVLVTEPVGELTEVSLRYPLGSQVSVYAGSGRRETEDGGLADCSFVSPEALSRSGDTLYLTDAGTIRILRNGQASTLRLEPDYLTADLVRGWSGDLYVLTGPWTGEDETAYYGFLRLSDRSADILYYTEAAWSAVTDFAFDSQGTLWFIQQNLGTGSTTLNTLDPDSLACDCVTDLPESTRGMAFDEEDNLYLSVPDSGVILRLGRGESSCTYFAGVEGERRMIDGSVPNFYRPTSLAAGEGVLYVLDFDTVRKITVEGAGALSTETLAGVPTADTNPPVALGPGEQAVLPASERASLVLDSRGQLLLSDPKNSVIYEIDPQAQP